jgi:tRNA(Ile)-lysidine synthetase-like protein
VAGDTVQSVRAAVERFVAQHSIPPNALLLAAVSGGQDSVCLLDALASTWPTIGGPLVAVHVNHLLRGPESTADASFVARMAARLGCECLTVEVDVAAYAREHALGLEEAGRYIRYQVLAETAACRGAWGAATGHTVDDLAETLLINLIRGTGSLGLAGIHPTQTYRLQSLGPSYGGVAKWALTDEAAVRVIRPLLDVTREQTEQYCHQQGLDFRRDWSNLDPAFLRNRIRHHLLPLLRSYNPSIVCALGRLAGVSADDEAELERSVDAAWQAHAAVGSAKVAFSWADWLAQSPAVQRRLLRRARTELSGTGAWSFDSLEAARLLLAGRPTRRRLSLGGGIQLSTTREGFQLTSSKFKVPG